MDSTDDSSTGILKEEKPEEEKPNELKSKEESSKEETLKEPAFPKIEAATELLQQILVDLPIRDLMVLQRVNKKWQGAIFGWSALQKALFFEPVEDVQLSLVEDGFQGRWPHQSCKSQSECQRLFLQSDLYVIINGRRYINSVFDPIPVEPQATPWAVDQSDGREYRIVINPLLSIEEPWSQMYFDEDDKGRDKFLRNTYRRRNASWRGMLFSQPPLKEAIVFHHGIGHFHIIRAKDPSSSKGLTLGDVHDSKRAFKAPIQSVWGEDGFSRGLSEDSPASEILEKLGLDPEAESLDKSDEEDWLHRMPVDYIMRQLRIKQEKLGKPGLSKAS